VAIKRYTADADNTLTNAFETNLVTRGTGSNMGRADILEVFHIFGQESSTSQELSRVLINFPVSDISTDRTNGDVPASGSVSFYLRMFNAPHASTIPRDITLSVMPVSQSWEEGYGLDMENYSDLTYDQTGSNWVNAGSGSTWTTAGGDFLDQNKNENVFDIAMEDGTEDIELDITPLVEDWIKGSGDSGVDNYGIVVRLTSSIETGGTTQYTKKFFARSSQYFFKRPLIEARWDSSTTDDRGNFYYSSSIAPAADNLNTLYLYNVIRGQLADIPGTDQGAIYVSVYSGSDDNSEPSASKLQLSIGGDVAAANDLNITGGYVSTGIYSATFAVTAAATPLTRLFDIWHDDAGVEFHTASITPKTFGSSNYNLNYELVEKVTNLKAVYHVDEKTTRFRLYTRQKNWNPNIYTKAIAQIENYPVETVYYSLYRTYDQYPIFAYGTGSSDHNCTKLSLDTTGSYFDIDVDALEPGYSYTLRFIYYLSNKYVEGEKEFKFRVEK
jgi:hypothetical protein